MQFPSGFPSVRPHYFPQQPLPELLYILIAAFQIFNRRGVPKMILRPICREMPYFIALAFICTVFVLRET